MKKLLSLMMLLVAIVTGAKAQDLSTYGWIKDSNFGDYIKAWTDEGVTLSSSATSWGGNSTVEGFENNIHYIALNSNASALDANYFGVASGNVISKISFFIATNESSAGTYNYPVVLIGWDTTDPGNTEAITLKTTFTINGAKKAPEWVDVDLSDYNLKSVRIYRKLAAAAAGTSSDLGNGKTNNVYGVKVYLVDESAVKHTVTYDLGAGEGTAPTQGDVAEAGTFTVKAAPADLVAPEGKEFKCWNDGTANYNAGATYTMGTSNVTLTAVYQKERDQKVVYSLVDGIGSAEVEAADATVNEGESLVLSNTAGRIKITASEGETFKAGDIITFTGTVGNQAKYFGVKYGATTSVSTDLRKSEAGDGTVSGTLTLSADASVIYIGRSDGTTTTLTNLVISRAVPSENIAFTDVTTYVTENAIDFAEVTDVAAYVVTGVNTTTNKVITKKVGAVPAGTALLIKGDGAEEVNVPIVESAEDPAANLFLISDGNVQGGDNIFAYSKTNKKFMKVATTVTVPAGKCYLQIDGVTNALDIDFEQATAVEAIAEANAEAAAPVKVIKNGKLYIGNFNVAGQQVK